MAGEREAKLVLGADGRKLNRDLGSARRAVSRWGRDIAKDIGRSMRGAMSGLMGIGGFAGIAGLAEAARQAKDFELRLVRLEIAGKASSSQMAKLRTTLDDVAKATGVGQNDLVGGLERFVALTGDMETGIEVLDTLARTAQASGSSLEDITVAAAALSKQMGIGANEMERVMSILISQGKDGAIELKDMSAIAAEILPRFAAFGETGVPGLAEMGAHLQLLRNGFSSAQESATGFNALMSAIVKNGRKLQAAGIKTTFVKDGVKQLRSLDDILFDIARRGDKDVTFFQQILGDKEAVQAMGVWAKFREDFDRIKESGADGQAVMNDFRRVSDTAAVKLGQLQAVLHETFVGLMANHLPDIVRGVNALVAGVKWIVEHKEELVAAFAAFHLGGMVSGSGMAGMAGTPGSSPGSRLGHFTNALGRSAQFAGVGLGMSAALGLDEVDTAVVSLGHAAAGALGPLAMLGTGILDMIAIAQSALIDAKNKAILADEFGSGAWRKLGAGLGRGTASFTGRDTTPGFFGDVMRAGGHGPKMSVLMPSMANDSSGAHNLLQSAERMGAEKNGFIDIPKFKRGLAGQKSLSAEDRKELLGRAISANAVLAGEAGQTRKILTEVKIRLIGPAGRIFEAEVGKERRADGR